MAGMQEVEWEECFVEPARNPELERYLRSGFGFVPPAALYFSECPWVARSLVAFRFPSGKLVHTDMELADKIGLVVSQDSSCRYCYAAHRMILRAIGMRQERIDRLEQDLLSADADPRERVALEFARRFSRASPPPSNRDVTLLLDAGYGEAAIKEMAVVAGYDVAANRFCTLPALPPQQMERLPDRWLVRLARPLLGRLLHSRWRVGTPESLEPELRSGAFSDLVVALDGLPVARSLRQVIDEAWASPILSARAKALVFAVVARGLGSRRSEQEASRLVAAEGLGDEDLRAILAHLASPKLDAIEALVVPFARETIWYRAGAIQRRARALREQLTPAQFLEAAGVAAFANMVCRLEIVVDGF